jgi:hypothetical protein
VKRMKTAKRVLLIGVSTVLPLVCALPSSSEVRIELRNGRSITADSCRDAGASLRCYKMGGTFEIDKRDMVSSRTTEGAEAVNDEGTPVEPEAAGAKRENADNTGQSPADATDAARKSSAARLDEIGRRKSELVKEREKLVKERLQLQEDVKKAPDWMMPERYNELNSRNADIDAKIRKFNGEVKALNDEEKKIREESSPEPKGSAGSSGSGVAPAAR